MQVPKWIQEHWKVCDNPMHLRSDCKSEKFSEDDLWYAYTIESSDMDIEYLPEERIQELCNLFTKHQGDISQIKEKYGEDHVNTQTIATEQLLMYYSVLYEREMKRIDNTRTKKQRI